MKRIVVATQLCRPNSEDRLGNIIADLFPDMEIQWIDDIACLLNRNEGETVIFIEKGLISEDFISLMNSLIVSSLKVIRISMALGLETTVIGYELEKIKGEWQVINLSKNEISLVHEKKVSEK